MTKLDQIRLAIYEKCEAGEITDAEKKTLLESAVEKYSEKEPLTDIEEAAVDSIVEGILTFTEAMEVINSNEEEEVEEGALEDLKNKATKAALKRASKSAIKSIKKNATFENLGKNVDEGLRENKVFVESFDKLKEQYDEIVEKTKDDVKDKNITSATKNLKSAENVLEKMKSLIQHTPTTLDNASMSHISTNLNSLVRNSIIVLATSMIAKIMLDVKISADEKKHMIAKYQFLTNIGNGIKVIRTKEPNLFKADAILVINKEIIKLKDLERKIDKLQGEVDNLKDKMKEYK